MTAFENLTTGQKVRATIHRDTKTICTETCHLLGLELTKPAMELIAELIYKKSSVYGTDLEAFAKHAKRQTVNADDVKLLVRRNTSLVAHISEMAVNSTVKEKRRKTVALPVAKQPETPTAAAVAAPLIQKEKETRETCEKLPVAENTSQSEDAQQMVMELDDMIDLTFD